MLSSVGIKAVVDELAPQFEKATKHKVTTVFGLASAHKTKIEEGEPFDVAILTPPLLDDLIAKGRVSAASKSTIARTGLGLMIKAGARKPDIGTVDAFKRTLLAAKSITFASAGASGVAFVATAKQLGIADAIKTQARRIRRRGQRQHPERRLRSGGAADQRDPARQGRRARRRLPGRCADLRDHGGGREREGVKETPRKTSSRS